MMEPTSEDAPWCFMISGEREHVTRGDGTAKSLYDLIVLLRSSLLDYANLVVQAASKSSSKVELDETGFYFDATPEHRLENVKNLDTRLVECIELMAMQYMTDLDNNLELSIDEDNISDPLELRCVNFLMDVGKVTKPLNKDYRWSKISRFHQSSDKEPAILDTPDWSLQDRITLLKDLARRFLKCKANHTMTHDFMCAGEQTLALLTEAGICKLVNGSSVFYEFVEVDE